MESLPSVSSGYLEYESSSAPQVIIPESKGQSVIRVPPSSFGYIEDEPGSAAQVIASWNYAERTAAVCSTLAEPIPVKTFLRRSPWVWVAPTTLAVLIVAGAVLGAILGASPMNRHSEPATTSQPSSVSSTLVSTQESSPTEAPKMYTILSANYAGRNITKAARLNIQQGPYLVVNMEPVDESWAFPGGDDPWEGVYKCLSLLHSYGDSIRTFVACDSQGNFTIVPGEPNPRGRTHEVMRQESSTPGFTIASVVWGAEEIMDTEVYNALYAYRLNGSAVPFTNQLFGADTLLGIPKSGVIWWTEDNFTTFEGIYAREGDQSFTLLVGM